jgi:hypothetical protein
MNRSYTLAFTFNGDLWGTFLLMLSGTHMEEEVMSSVGLTWKRK